MATTFWPASALEGDQDQILDHLERSTPIRLIATFDDLTVALADEPVRAATSRADDGRFDFLPVRDSASGSIVGLFRRSAMGSTPDRSVREVMQPLSGDNLVGADTPLLDFVFSADTHPCRLVLDRSEIRGVVTLSDLQRLPVRTALFGLFIHLELLVTEALRGVVGADQSPFDWLSENRATYARSRWEESRAAGMDRDPLETLSFGDKKTLAKKAKLFGIPGERINRELQDIEQYLRDPIAHGLTIAATEEQARTVVRVARLVRDWISMCRESGGGNLSA